MLTKGKGKETTIEIPPPMRAALVKLFVMKAEAAHWLGQHLGNIERCIAGARSIMAEDPVHADTMLQRIRDNHISADSFHKEIRNFHIAIKTIAETVGLSYGDVAKRLEQEVNEASKDIGKKAVNTGV